MNTKYNLVEETVVNTSRIDNCSVVIDSDDEEDYPGQQEEYKKRLSNKWSEIVEWSIGLGNNHFGITINIPQFCIGDGSDPKVIENFQRQIKLSLSNNYPTITWYFAVTEHSKKGQPHFHSIVAIKNFIDYNYILKNNIKHTLIKCLEGYFDHEGFLDIRVDSLLYFKDIKNWIMYMNKNINEWKYKGFFSTTEKCYCKVYLIGSLNDIYSYFIKPFEMVDFIFSDTLNIDKHHNFDFDINAIEDLNGIKLTNNKIDQRTLINILQYYLILKQYYLYNDNIYVKIKNSKMSYSLVGSIKEVLYDNFQKNVVIYFINNFGGYFKGFDFSYLMDNYFIKTRPVIESIKDISTQRIEPDFGLIEFTDGVYSIKHNRFLPHKIGYLFSSNVSTLKFYNKSYSRVSRTKPNNWINGLKNALGIDKLDNEIKNQDFIRLCMHIINPIHKDIFNKKSTLFIHGQSNTGKTTLVSDIFSRYFGPENIGSIINAKNFKWQDLIGKVLGLIDEGRYNSSMSSDLLKITGQENIIVEKKYSKEHIVIKPIPLVILTNILFEDKDILIDEALKNRLYIIEFINKISKESIKNSFEFKKKLKDEEASIIIYCNKLFFKTKENYTKPLGKKISNTKIINLIENKKYYNIPK